MRYRRNLTIVWVGVLVSSLLMLPATFAQDSTGLPRYGSFDELGIDTINLANLNLHVDIPIFQRKSRGYTESWDFVYDSTIYNWENEGFYGYLYVPGTIEGGVSQHTLGPEPPAGGVGYTVTPQLCDPNEPNGPYEYVYGPYVMTDANNTPHGFSVQTYDDSECGGSISTDSGYTDDGSGYYITASGSQYTVTNLGGIQSGSSASQTYPIDTNGDIIPRPANGQFEDTSGAIMTYSSSGSVETYTYIDSNGSSQHFTVTYQPFQMLAYAQNPFNGQMYTFGPQSQSLPVSIALPDGTSYQFTYEVTPGNPGYTTGRLASITLP